MNKYFIDLHTHLNLLKSPLNKIIQTVFGHELELNIINTALKNKNRKGIFVVNFYNFFPFENSFEDLLRQKENLDTQIKNHKDLNIQIILNKQDLLKDFNIGIILALESCRWLAPNWQNSLDKLWDQGIRMITPIHFSSNFIGASCNEPFVPTNLFKGVYLTSEGKKFLNFASNKGFLIDLSHTRDETLEDIAKLNINRVLYSHIGIRDFVNKKRNVTIKNLSLFKEKEPLLGLIPWRNLMKNKDIIKRIIDHFSHHNLLSTLSVGTDYGAPIATIEGMKNYSELINFYENFPIEEELKEMILYKNALNFLTNNLPNE